MSASHPVLARRGHGMSAGAIAGTVIGSVLGGFILALVLGFLYFRYRRKVRIAQAEEGLSVSKTPDTYDPASLPWQDSFPSQTLGFENGPSFGVDYGDPGGSVPVIKTEPDTQIPPGPPEGYGQMSNGQAYIQPGVGNEAIPRSVDFSLSDRQRTFPMAAGKSITAPLNHVSTAPEAANSSYYDTRISMDSEPAGDITPPTRFMSEMYKAQLKEAQEHRRSNSIPRRIWNAVMRRQTTLKSEGSDRNGPQASRSQQFGEQPVPYNAQIKQEPGQTVPGDYTWQAAPFTSNLVEEPDQISEDGTGSGAVGAGVGRGDYQPHSHQKFSRGQTDDSQYGGFPYRFDSTIRETTERDPELPSSALNPDSTYGLPHEAQPHGPTELRERLQSPEIPEPMDVDGLQPDNNSQSPFRSSYSPQLSPESFTINPMAILHPTTPAEQAAYNSYQLKNSVSPAPLLPTPAPEINTQQQMPDITVDLSLPKENDFADMYLDLPSDEENRRSSDSYEYPTTPMHSSSEGRTPDTQPEVSPVPYPNGSDDDQLKPDAGVSPGSSKRSPQSGPLICPECGREFDQIHKLNHHKRYHDRTHECTYAGCDRKFGTKTHLDRHINDRHLKSKTYHCTEPTCAWFRGGKSFPRKDNWRRHMMKKHGTTAQEFENMEPL